MKRVYIAAVVGAGRRDDPYRSALAGLPGLRGHAAQIPTGPDGQPLYADCLTVVLADDLTPFDQAAKERPNAARVLALGREREPHFDPASLDVDSGRLTGPPGSFVSDTFTDTAGTALESHTGETGASWTKHPSYSGGGVITNADRLRIAGTPNAQYYASGLPAGAEYDVEAVWRRMTDVAGSLVGACARMSTSADTTYITLAEGSDLMLFKTVAGSATLLGSYTPGWANTTDYTVKLQIRDAAKKVFLGGTERISSSDNAITTAGRAGWYGDASTTPSDTTGWQTDSLAATDYALIATPDVGAAALSGAVPVVEHAPAPAAGALILTGAVPVAAVLAQADAATVSLTGLAATAAVVATPGVAVTTLSGAEATWWFAATPGAGVLVASGLAANVTHLATPDVGGVVTLSGQDATAAVLTEAGAASATLTGLTPTAAAVATPTAGAAALSGLAPIPALTAAPAAATLTASAPAPTAAVQPTPAAGQADLSGLAAAATITATPAAGVITLYGFGFLAAALVAEPDTGTVALSGAAAAAAVTTTAAQAALTVSGNAAAIEIAATPSLGVLVASGAAATAASTVAPPAATATLSGASAAVLITAGPPPAALTLSGLEPTIVSGGPTEAELGVATLTGVAATVRITAAPAPASVQLTGGTVTSAVTTLAAAISTLTLSGLAPRLRTAGYAEAAGDSPRTASYAGGGAADYAEAAGVSPRTSSYGD